MTASMATKRVGRAPCGRRWVGEERQRTENLEIAGDQVGTRAVDETIERA